MHGRIMPVFMLLLSLLFPLSSSSQQESAPLPVNIAPPGEKLILVDPRLHAWGAYSAGGSLVRWGLASAGANWCPDIKKPCRTKTGAYRIFALGDSDCISARFPIPTGGAPMPYCMYFNGNQALHGSPAVVRGNISHGCVRMHVSDAYWLRYDFIDGTGTLVVIRPY